MEQDRPASPARATLFYSTSLLLLTQFGGVLQRHFGLPGFVATQAMLFLGLALLFSVMVGGPPPGRLLRLRRLTVTGVLKSLLLGLLGWALTHAMGSLIIYLVTALGGKLPELYQSITQAPFLVAILVGALVPAICEEAAFRGYMLWNLRPVGPRAAIVITAVLFGIMHMSLIRVVPLIVLGLLFSAAVQRTGSLLPGMIMHFLQNATALSLSYYVRSIGAVSEVPTRPNMASLVMLTMAVLVLGAMAWSLLRSFGPADLAKPLPEPEADPAPAAQGARKAERDLMFPALLLLPALAIYVWAVSLELKAVF